MTISWRAAAFGAISAAAGIGSAAGPLIGGLITSAASWRLAFVAQALLVIVIIVLSQRIKDAGVHGPTPQFDFAGAVLSAAGLFFIVVGFLQAGTYGWFRATQDFVIGGRTLISAGGVSPVWLFELIGALLLALFFWHIGARERAGQSPLLATRMFQNRESNLGLVTQCVQWLTLLGLSFVVSVYLQTVRGFSAIETGLILTPATIGILAAYWRHHWRQVGWRSGTRGGPHSRGLHHHDLGDLSSPVVCPRHVQRAHLRAGSAAGRAWRRSDAHFVGQRRAIQLSRKGPGGDLGSVAQH